MWRAACNSMVFESSERIDSVRPESPHKVFRWAIKANIFVEVTVVRIARIADLGAPNETRSLHITPESRNSRWTNYRGVGTVARFSTSLSQPVSFENRVANALIGQHVVQSGVIRALRQPKAQRIATEKTSIGLHAEAHLSPNGRRRVTQVR